MPLTLFHFELEKSLYLIMFKEFTAFLDILLFLVSNLGDLTWQ